MDAVITSITVILVLISLSHQVNAQCYGSCFYISWWFWASISFSLFLLIFFVIMCYQKKYRHNSRRVGFVGQSSTATVLTTTNVTGAPYPIHGTVYNNGPPYGMAYNGNKTIHSHNQPQPYADPVYPPSYYPPSYEASSSMPSAPYDANAASNARHDPLQQISY